MQLSLRKPRHYVFEVGAHQQRSHTELRCLRHTFGGSVVAPAPLTGVCMHGHWSCAGVYREHLEHIPSVNGLLGWWQTPRNATSAAAAAGCDARPGVGLAMAPRANLPDR